MSARPPQTTTLVEFYEDLYMNPGNLAQYFEDPEAYLEQSGLSTSMISLIRSEDAAAIKSQIATDLGASIDDLIGIILLWFRDPRVT